MIIYNPETFIQAELIEKFVQSTKPAEGPFFWTDHYGLKSPLILQAQSLCELTEALSVELLWQDTEREDQSENTILRRLRAQQAVTKFELNPEKMMIIIKNLIEESVLFRVNRDHPEFETWLSTQVNDSTPAITSAETVGKREKKRVNVLGLGDVGSTMALALSLYGGEAIGEIGLYDLDENRLSRWEQEINQIAEPLMDTLPKVRILKETELFDCDLFAFTASVGVPPVGVQDVDVRVVQFNGNAKLVSLYGHLAVERAFKGIFAVVSDPVDQLCRHLYESTNKDSEGHWHGEGLHTEQIRGYGLGVMNGRAAYFAKQKNVDYGDHGRVYGPHGKGLVVANHWSETGYIAEASEWLTEKTITANLEMRKIGYKPYIAPAVASGAIAITKTLLEEWHYSCISFDGFYYGCLNKRVSGSDFWEKKALALSLQERIRQSSEELNAQWESL